MNDTVVTSADGTAITYRTMGGGPAMILFGGTLRTADDYLPLASALAGSFTVHLVQRRGRGDSGPLGPDYSLRKEVEDLLAVRAETGARLAFGHSYGGLALLEAARTSGVFDRIAVYEPGVPVAPVPTGWMAPYRERLAAGDPYGAFVHFIRGSGGAPPFMEKLPHWYLRTVMRLFYRGAGWRRMRPLLAANVAEHGQIAAQQGRLAEFAAVKAAVLVLCGGRSKAAHREEFAALRDMLPDAALETLDRLDHFGPEGRTAAVVASRVRPFLDLR
ncbi:alpha/beta fold hydrolase [Nonomuraea jabiensis]|uniref:alpha/beta fold hydrolase n=1 Tax=Nonomuraea jabiensis TaxID=882448 RepID=UPI003D711751